MLHISKPIANERAHRQLFNGVKNVSIRANGGKWWPKECRLAHSHFYSAASHFYSAAAAAAAAALFTLSLQSTA
eukprot:5891429-Pleurochrysis_carterae.AAC.1